MLFFKSNKNKLPITREDKEWIEGNFEWLINSVGPLTLIDTDIIDKSDILFSKQSPEELLERICEILHVSKEQIFISYYEDIKSKEWTVIAPMGEFEDVVSGFKETEKDGKAIYEITLAKSLLKNKTLLTAALAYELSRVKLRNLNLDFEAGPDTGVFLYLAAVYFGFGLFISNSVFVNEDGYTSQSNVPLEIVGYSLALHYYLRDKKESWPNQINSYIKPHFETSLKYLESNPPERLTNGYILSLIQTATAEKAAFEAYDKGEYDKAIELYKEVEFLDPDNPATYNNLGYFKLRINNFKESISDFNKAIHLDPDFSFPYNNKGFALMMLGDLEEGFNYINKSLLLDDSNSYAYRNLGIYYSKKQQFEKAFENFKTAIEIDPNTELLHYYYGTALLENGDLKEAVKELKKSAEKGEQVSIRKLRELPSF